VSNGEENRCPACGGYISSGREVENFVLCSHCATKENVDTALKIASSKHKERLKDILAELKKEG